MNGFGAVGDSWTPEEFRKLELGQALGWVRGVTVHHTAAPSLTQRPDGFAVRHVHNLRAYYQGLGWSAGPHLFVDDKRAWGMCPLGRPGIHAVSFNQTHVGVEVLGNYDEEDPDSGRGLQCWTVAVQIVAHLLAQANLGPTAINGHRDDPVTRKSCPGRLVQLEGFRNRVERWLAEPPAEPPPLDRAQILERLGHVEWQIRKIREILG